MVKAFIRFCQGFISQLKNLAKKNAFLIKFSKRAFCVLLTMARFSTTNYEQKKWTIPSSWYPFETFP